MKENNIKKDVLDIFKKVSNNHKKSDGYLLEIAYLDDGFIDSFQLVEMIATLENHFRVKFDASELTSQEFRTLKGVISIIENNIKRK